MICVHIGKFVVAYFDNLVNRKSLDQHVEHLRCVLVILKHENLYANLKLLSYFEKF